MQKSKPSAFESNILKRLFKLSGPHAKLFWFTFLFTILFALLSTIRPYIIQYIIDNFIPKGDFKNIYLYSAIVFGMLILSTVFQLLSSYLGALLGQLIIKDLNFEIIIVLVSECSQVDAPGFLEVASVFRLFF
ncbi:MAG: hypothetical protein JHD28_11880 [Bacteroidia bacterium]|nr:hypothetical protein [Bacteroidia bacterium]